jgi:hypothetical protein
MPLRSAGVKKGFACVHHRQSSTCHARTSISDRCRAKSSVTAVKKNKSGVTNHADARGRTSSIRRPPLKVNRRQERCAFKPPASASAPIIAPHTHQHTSQQRRIATPQLRSNPNACDRHSERTLCTSSADTEGANRRAIQVDSTAHPGLTIFPAHQRDHITSKTRN